MLQKVNFLPGFNKQVTPTGAEGQWTGGDNVRFRYGLERTECYMSIQVDNTMTLPLFELP